MQFTNSTTSGCLQTKIVAVRQAKCFKYAQVTSWRQRVAEVTGMRLARVACIRAH